MAWIANEFGHVLMERQAQGNRQWTLPGGEVLPNEGVLEALEGVPKRLRQALEHVGPLWAQEQYDEAASEDAFAAAASSLR